VPFRAHNMTLGRSLAFRTLFFCKFLFLYDFNGFVYVFCYHKRLKSSTKVEDEASSLISYLFLMFLFIQFHL
jgi:hypothetical protein